LRHYAREVQARLASLDVDAVLSPGTIPVAYLETSLPLVTWTDATFASMLDYYPEFSGVSPHRTRAGHEMERAALSRVDAAVYSSAWAARSAVEDYGADPARVSVIPFGANLENEPDGAEVARAIEARSRQECRLLFMGVDWDRKGGDIALALASRLTESGVPTRLTVIGCRPAGTRRSGLVDSFGFVPKSTADGEATIRRLLGGSHFLCLPSRADCTPIACCEASAYGLPSLVMKTGGVESVVRHGANGWVFDPEPFVERAADAIARGMSAYDDVYLPLAAACREEYLDRLNWAVSASTVLELVSRLVSRK
jgi:glycosyltransferase involved in cell wall biosynthesis